MREYYDWYIDKPAEEEKQRVEGKFVVEYKDDENSKYWDYVDDNHVIEADDEKDAIEMAKAKFIEFYGDEFTEEEVDSWTWRAAEVIHEEYDPCSFSNVKVPCKLGEYVYAA